MTTPENSNELLGVTITGDNEKGFVGTRFVGALGYVHEVTIVGRRDENGVLDKDNARYYVSPLVGRIAFEDISKGIDVHANFSGRSLNDIVAWLTKNTK